MGDDGMPVGEVAARLGVTVRTLHHWDEIDLARPAARSTAGYRLYTGDDLERLRRILVYRELGLDLEAIRAVLDERGGDVAEQLKVQRAQLAQRIAQLRDLDDDLGRMIEAQERGILLSEDEQRSTFGPDWNTRWPSEAKDAYGGSAQWQQYAEKSASRSAEDWAAVMRTVEAFEADLAAAVDQAPSRGMPSLSRSSSVIARSSRRSSRSPGRCRCTSAACTPPTSVSPPTTTPYVRASPSGCARPSTPALARTASTRYRGVGVSRPHGATRTGRALRTGRFVG